MSAITGTEDPDTLVGTAGDDTIDALGGDDTVLARDGNDVVYGGDGADFVRGEGGDDVIYGGAGDDLLYGGSTTTGVGAGNDTLYGGDGDDLLRGGAGVDAFYGGDGNDRVSFFHFDATQGVVVDLRTQQVLNDGYGNAETLSSIEGVGDGTMFADTYWGSEVGGTFLLGKGDKVYAGAGNDSFQLDDTPALIDGGDGVDTLIGWSGFRLVDTDHNGIAEQDLSGPPAGVIINLADHRIYDDGWGDSGKIINVENITGALLNDILTGDGGANVIVGLDGDDILNGGGGADSLDGGVGNDQLSGGGGDDTLTAGDGDDSAYGGAGNDTVDGGAGNDLLSGDGGNDSLTGGDGADDIDGGVGADTLDGGTGNDTLDGGDGADELSGGDDNDALFGGAGNDTLTGGVGDDTLTGGNGRDTLVGGAGSDTFIFTEVSNSLPGARDTIVDLTSADWIDLSAIDADTGTAGDQAFTLVSAFDGHAGEMTLSYSGPAGRTTLNLDVNGDGVADMSIFLTGNQMAFTNFHP
jgi:Ca2+-binding RTX toxin-like protein